MLKVCENCIDRQLLSYEDLIPVCGRCREVKKADLVDHADKKDPFNGHRWNKGKQTKLSYKTIKKLYDEGKTQTEIAKLFNVKQPTISKLLKGGK